jgi:hypothetical protein
MPYLRADGSSDGKRLAQLDDDENGGAMQRLFPLRFPPGAAGWLLRLAGGREVRVAPLSAAARQAALQAAGWRDPVKDWTLQIDGDIAIVTLPTFAFWGGKFDGKAWLAKSFAQLAEQGVRHLVIDLRRNEGGDDGLGCERLPGSAVFWLRERDFRTWWCVDRLVSMPGRPEGGQAWARGQ